MISARIFLIGSQTIEWFPVKGMNEIEAFIRKNQKPDESRKGKSRIIYFVFLSAEGNFEMIKSYFSEQGEMKKLLNKIAWRYRIEEKDLYNTMAVDTVFL